MRWGDLDVEYPRPLQWILMLHGSEVVEAEVGGVVSGRSSRGHRTLSNDKSIEVAQPSDYVSALAEVGVMVDQEDRRAVIAKGLAAGLSNYSGEAHLIVDDELLTEVVFLCEYPTPFIGAFSAEYLVLPAAVITTALKSHQRYFSVSQADGETLLPCFAAVRDGGADHLDNVTKGNERVIHARLADALFYWNFDQQKTPDERTAMLSTVTWLEGFGSVLDKTKRLEVMAAWLWQNGMGEDGEVPADLSRAAQISKSDLVSEMIKDGKEFTKLEGFIGAKYAELAGESKQVCRSIERQYYPRSSTGELPGDQHAAILSVADRLDNVAGCWLAGFVPTGAKDPYALRRHVLAMLRIVIDRGVRIDMSAALSKAIEGVASFAADKDLVEAKFEIEEFVKTRLGNHLVDVLKVDPDVTRAILPLRWSDPGDALAWVKALAGYREKADFQLLATGFKRCRNILKGDTLDVSELDLCRQRWRDGGSGSQGEDLSQLPESLERDLLASVVAVVPELDAAEAAGDYERVFAALSGLGPTIDAFFEGVMVNAEDVELKKLRFAFLREIHGLFRQFADFAEVAAS
ncbi:MAG: glycyl-tRNA synthetase beta chain [Candidatus Krumholzibacteriia bacterium]|jgi:glycyl-tRNA synthetase beta chain